jgi:tetratricopeptide (TPR) repeat protein
MARKSAESAQDALDRAQQLIYDAWEASTSKRRIALAEKALAISPLCADAYVLLAEHAKRGSDQELDLWRRGVEAGEKALGEAGFEEYAGEFWGFLETRPYMRARFGLAQALWARGVRGEAIDHLRELLRLNPNDNQGARYVLAARLAEVERDNDLAVLLKTYPDDGACAWSWTAALASFRGTGDSKKSRTLLAAALADNAHVPAYLLGEQPLPKSLPPYISFGGEDEAIYYAVDFRAGWVNTAGAIDWLRTQAPEPKTAKRRPAWRSRLQ